MNLLAIDTSGERGSIAILRDGSLVHEMTMDPGSPASALLLSSIRELCGYTEIGIKSVDLFAVALGPGSFTGVRVGVSVVKGLAWAQKKQVAGVSSLMAMVMNVRCDDKRTICSMTDARRGDIYYGLYRRVDKACEVVKVDLVAPPDEVIEGLDGDIVFIGNGIEICREMIRDRMPGAYFMPSPSWRAGASNVGQLACRMADEWTAPRALAPLYLRQFDPRRRSDRNKP